MMLIYINRHGRACRQLHEQTIGSTRVRRTFVLPRLPHPNSRRPAQTPCSVETARPRLKGWSTVLLGTSSIHQSHPSSEIMNCQEDRSPSSSRALITLTHTQKHMHTHTHMHQHFLFSFTRVAPLSFVPFSTVTRRRLSGPRGLIATT
jgi:hypothetical protein